MCKTGISRLIAALAVCTMAAGASAQSSSGFATDRNQQFLMEAEATPGNGALSASWSMSANDWDKRIESAGAYKVAPPRAGDKPWYDDEERLITTLAIVVLILIILK